MRKQPWYTGSFATIGSSYLGFTQWALLSDPPEDMKAAVITTGPLDMAAYTWGNGVFRSDVIGWADIMNRVINGKGRVPLPLCVLFVQRSRLKPVFDGVPLSKALDKHFEGEVPHYLIDNLSLSDIEDPYWKPLRLQSALEKANMPIFLISGWWDVMLVHIMDQYSRLSERGCTVALTVGPWTHLGCQGPKTATESLIWLDEQYSHRTKCSRPAPVRVFITGAQQWRELQKWPPPTSSYALYLHPGKKLANEPPKADGPDSVFKYDPANPTPAISVSFSFDQDNNPKEDTALAARSDLISFSTEPLTHDVEVCGKPAATLHHSTDNPHADLLVRLSEVTPAGRSFRVAEKYFRLDHPSAPKPEAGGDGAMRVMLHDCAHRFRAGSRIRLLLAGSSHAQYLRNLGTGESQLEGATVRPAWHTVRHGAVAPSMLDLPVTGTGGEGVGERQGGTSD